MNPILIIQNCEAETPGTIVDYLHERQKQFDLVRSYDGEPLPPPQNYQGVIDLGCPHSVTTYSEYPYLRSLFAFVAETVRLDVPYLGICFGGQILARVLGAEVRPNPVKEIGTHNVRLTPSGQQDTLFSGFSTSFPVFQWHGDTFKIPFGADNLVEGTDCRNQAFRRGRQVGLQFHLESSALEVSRWCEVYDWELKEKKLNRADIVGEYERHASSVRDLNFRLLDNFFTTIANSNH